MCGSLDLGADGMQRPYLAAWLSQYAPMLHQELAERLTEVNDAVASATARRKLRERQDARRRAAYHSTIEGRNELLDEEIDASLFALDYQSRLMDAAENFEYFEFDDDAHWSKVYGEKCLASEASSRQRGVGPRTMAEMRSKELQAPCVGTCILTTALCQSVLDEASRGCPGWSWERRTHKAPLRKAGQRERIDVPLHGELTAMKRKAMKVRRTRELRLQRTLRSTF